MEKVKAHAVRLIRKETRFVCRGPPRELRAILLSRIPREKTPVFLKNHASRNPPVVHKDDTILKEMNCWGFVLHCMVFSEFITPERALELFEKFNFTQERPVFIYHEQSGTHCIDKGNYFYGTWDELISRGWEPSDPDKKVIILSTENSCQVHMEDDVVKSIEFKNSRTFYSHVGLLVREEGELRTLDFDYNAFEEGPPQDRHWYEFLGRMSTSSDRFYIFICDPTKTEQEVDSWKELPVVYPSDEEYAIGIDLGTNSSCAGVYTQGTSLMFTNNQLNIHTPSYVTFTDDRLSIGDISKQEISAHPHNTVYDAMRIIGRKFNDEEVQGDVKYWSFNVIDKNNKPNILLSYKNKEKTTITPEDVICLILGNIKDCAEKHFNIKISNAVIAVPFNFNVEQRKDIKNAATNAGLNVIGIMNSSTAAANAIFDIRAKIVEQGTILVFDLGGGKLEVSMLNVREEDFDLVATVTEPHLGGGDFDNRMVQHLYDNHFKQEIQTKDVGLVRNLCERAKINLTSNEATFISVTLNKSSFKVKVTRKQFEDMNDDLFKKCITKVEEILKAHRVEKENVVKVVLIGGSTKIPKVRELLSAFFESNSKIHMAGDTAVAHGATLWAARLHKQQK